MCWCVMCVCVCAPAYALQDPIVVGSWSHVHTTAIFIQFFLMVSFYQLESG